MRADVRGLAPGAILAETVCGPGGRQLAEAGTTLTAQHLQVLRAWGVEAIEVSAAAAPVDDQALKAAQRIVATRFRGQPPDHPAVRVLFQAAVARRLRSGA